MECFCSLTCNAVKQVENINFMPCADEYSQSTLYVPKYRAMNASVEDGGFRVRDRGAEHFPPMVYP